MKVYVIVNQWEPYPGALELQENVEVTTDEDVARESVDHRNSNATGNEKYYYETWEC